MLVDERWWSNWFWPAAGSVIGLTGLILSYLIFRWSRQAPILFFEEIDLSFIEINPDTRVYRRLPFKGMTSEQVNTNNVFRFALFGIKNIGHAPIEPQHFARDIRFCFAEDVDLFFVDVAKTEPSNINPTVEVEGTCITLKPTLLNPGESIVFRALLGRGHATIVTDIRLVGTRLKKYSSLASRRPRVWLWLIGWLAATVPVSYILEWLNTDKPFFHAWMLSFVTFTLFVSWRLLKLKFETRERIGKWSLGPESGVWGQRVSNESRDLYDLQLADASQISTAREPAKVQL